MVARTYTAPQFNVRDERQAPTVQVAQADTRPAAPIVFGDANWRDRLFEQFGRQASATLDKMADIAFSNLYLEGQAAAGVIDSEAELNGSPLTRDWKVAGYRDTMGKLALADAEASFNSDIAKLREGNPGDMQAYLTKRRGKLMPAVSGMSREARAAAAGQLLLQDRAALKTYTTEHTKFVIEQKSQAVHAQWNSSLRTLGAAQTRVRLGEAKLADFQAQLRTTAGTIVGSVWKDTSLPEVVKRQLTFEMIQNTLSNDSVELYDFLAQNEIPDGAGGSSTLTSRLDGKQQLQLANAYREAQSRTSDQRNLYQMEQIANVEAQLDNNAYLGSYEDLDAMLTSQVMRGAITGERRAALLNKFVDSQFKGEEQSVLASMALRGDINGILNYGPTGKTEADAMAAVDASLARSKASPEQRLSTYLQMGMNGMDGGFQKAGTVLGVSLRQVRSPDGTILPQHMTTFKTINDAVRRAEEGGNRNARMQLLSGLSESDRMFATRVFAQVDANKSADEAIALAADAEAREAAMTPSMRAATGQSVAKDVSTAIDAIEPMNWLETAWTFTKSVFSAGAASDLRLRTTSEVGFKDGWFSDNPVARMYAEGVRTEVRDEASRVLLTNPTASADEVVLTAKANVASRTVQTRHGPIVLPHRANASQIFGVGNANLSKVGPAIDKMLQETKADARWHVQFTHRGVFVQEYDNAGTQIGTGHYLDPKNVRTAVQGLMNDEQAEADAQHGRGRKVNRDGVSFRYNGVNTAGVQGAWMVEFRDNLVNNESVRATPYRDLSGAVDKAGKPIMTVGVGVSSHNPRYPKVGADGKVEPDAIRTSFLAASNDAAIAGRKIAQSVGLDNKAGFALLSEIAYQSGTSFATSGTKTAARYQKFLQALQSGDAETAKAAFKQTAAWYYSASPSDRTRVTARQQNYMRLIEQSIQGG